MLGRICGVAIAFGLFGAPALGQTIEGVYTTFDAKKCRQRRVDKNRIRSCERVIRF